MSDKPPSLQELIEVQGYFGLPSPALVEKDWYVVKAISAINAIDTTPIQLVFGGGTSLSRAYRLINRMSEDVDLRIVADKPQPRPVLRRLRDDITKTLLGAGFQFDPNNQDERFSRNVSRYTCYKLPYEPITLGEGALRPEIKLETSEWPLRRSPAEKAVISFIAEAFNQSPEVESVACVSIAETAADKFVALTRRIGEQTADNTSIRHLYDLHMIFNDCDPEEIITLCREIMVSEAQYYGRRFPAYQENPVRETLRAVDTLRNDPVYAKLYADFQRDMVYGEEINFETAFSTVRDLSLNLE